MLTFKELHDTLEALKKGRAHRPVVEAVLDHTLEGLVQLEADFHTLCREVASLSQMSNSCPVTPEFDLMCKRRGVVLPD